MKNIIKTIIIICTINVQAQKDSITWSKAVLAELRPYAPMSGNTLSNNSTISFFGLAEKGRKSFLLMKGLDPVDINSGANYLFTEYAYKNIYKSFSLRYSLLTSISQPSLGFDPNFSMSGISTTIATKKYPRLELVTYYLVPWQNSLSNVIVKPRIVWEKKKGTLSVNSWYNSGMFGKSMGLSCGIDYSSSKIQLSKDLNMNLIFVYNYDVAGNLLKIKDHSSKDVCTMRAFLWF